jgi:hypothetical protein
VSDPPTVPITAAPRFLTVDPTTNTLYVSTKDNSTVAMVDTSSCNGHHPAGCSAAPAVVHVGYLPYGVVTDPLSHRLFVGNVGDSTVTAYDTRKCNAHTTARCDATINVDAGGWPLGLTIDDQTQTLYVRNNTDASVSIIDARHPLRP